MALAAFHDRGEDCAVSVRSDLGGTEEINVSIFFREEDAFEDWETIALSHCGRRVLDVGAGVGAHALVLQGRGHPVTALEPLPEAVRIMAERGVKDVREGTVFDLPSALTFDTAILLMNGSMIAETLSGLDRLLRAVGEVLAPGGAFILDSTDLRDAPQAAGGGAPEGGSEGEPGRAPERDDGRYCGELHYQLSVADQVGEIFPQLFVDPETLEERARLGGWEMEVIWSGPGGHYLARLRRPTE